MGLRNLSQILDGNEMPEKEFSRKWRVNFTPTIVFLRQGDLSEVPLKLAEAARMPGYLKPFHFISMFEIRCREKIRRPEFSNASYRTNLTVTKQKAKKPDIW